MKQAVFPQKKVSTFLNKHFVLIMLNANDKLPNGYNFMGTPTFYVINESGKKMGMILGGSNADNFIKKLKDILR